MGHFRVIIKVIFFYFSLVFWIVEKKAKGNGYTGHGGEAYACGKVRQLWRWSCWFEGNSDFSAISCYYEWFIYLFWIMVFLIIKSIAGNGSSLYFQCLNVNWFSLGLYFTLSPSTSSYEQNEIGKEINRSTSLNYICWIMSKCINILVKDKWI